MKIPIIIDTDPGHDDALAIILGIKCNLFDIKAITTVCGNSTIENTTRNGRYILKLLNREDINLYSGSSKPIEGNLIQAIVHGSNGLAGLNPKNEINLTNNAVEKILYIVNKFDKQITLVTLGPLTNVANAIKKNPKIMLKLKEIVIMGGAINVCGNKSRVSEFNIYVDSKAAKIVFNFPVKKTLVPLDACNHIYLTLKDFQKIKDEKLRKPILSMMKPYIKNISQRIDKNINGALMYDPLTIYTLINPKVCPKKKYDILVETKGELTKGMLIIEKRKSIKKTIT